jgi:hypothetical protein
VLFYLPAHQRALVRTQQAPLRRTGAVPFRQSALDREIRLSASPCWPFLSFLSSRCRRYRLSACDHHDGKARSEYIFPVMP